VNCNFVIAFTYIYLFNNVNGKNIFGFHYVVSKKVKQSLYTPWRHLGGEEV
jgi:hypothetical protein